MTIIDIIIILISFYFLAGILLFWSHSKTVNKTPYSGRFSIEFKTILFLAYLVFWPAILIIIWWEIKKGLSK